MIGSLPSPVIFAHRGASAHAPENTLSAFVLARDLGANAIELDVQLTADQAVVVFHDMTVNRTTNGTGKISDFSLSTIKKLNAGHAYGSAYENERIPSLADVFTKLTDFPLINIELKNLSSPTDNLPALVADLIKKHRMEDRVLISSFNPIALRKFHKIIPDIPLGRFFHKPPLLEYFHLFPFQLKMFKSIHISFSELSIRWVKLFHSMDKLVFTYTLNNPGDMIEALNLGVDGFFTNAPGLAKRTIIQNTPK